jgi:protease II
MAQEQVPKPPTAKKVPKTTRIHGYTVTDDYAWLADKDKKDPEVLAYLRAEDDYANAMMKSTTGFQESLYKELLARIKETDENVPYKNGAYFYYTRTEQGKQYPIFCRKKGDLKAAEEITLDMNKMAEGHKFFSIGAYNVSEDGNLLAFSTDITGFRQYKLHVKDLRTGKITENIAERVTSVAWANDNQTVFYGQEDLVTKRSHKHLGDSFYIRTNDQGKNFRLVTAPVSDPSVANWKEIIPHRKEVKIEDVDCFATHFVAVERENGVPKLRVTDLKSGKSHYVEFPEPVYVAYPGPNAEFNTTTLRFSYESFITPDSVFDYDVVTRKRELKKQQPVLGGYDSKLYQSERIYATASDGVKVPISIVYRKELKRDGSRPMLLGGYGSYGIPNDVDFSSNRLSLLDRGVICRKTV